MSGEVRQRKKGAAAAATASKPVGGDGQEISQATTATQGLLQSVRDRVNSIYRDVIDPVADPFRFRSRPSKGEIMASPLVFFLGNHSSGKSSFVNFLLNRETLQSSRARPCAFARTLTVFFEKRRERHRWTTASRF